MFELTTSNLDQELREEQIADGLRRRQLLAAARTTVTEPTRGPGAARTQGREASTGVARRATAQR